MLCVPIGVLVVVAAVVLDMLVYRAPVAAPRADRLTIERRRR